MQIIIPSDVFPPSGKGGAAWSSHALALALQARGHRIKAVVPDRGGRGISAYDALGVPALRVGYSAPRLPIIQNYFRHEKFWKPLANAIVAATVGQPDVIHAQHVQVAPAAVLAGRRLNVPVVVTVRDHWPWDYFATGLHGDRIPHPVASWASLATDLPARLGPLRGVLALPAIPYMLAHLRRRAAFLAQADAVIACSTYIARRLRGIVPPERIHVLPHMVDHDALAATLATPSHVQVEGPMLLFVGKLEANKGAGLLPAIFRELRGGPLPTYTLLVAGDGGLRGWLAQELGRLGVAVQFLDWAGHDEVLRLMARADLLLFPSSWGEPLSRVLLEATSVGTPILAMPTGGTPDIICDGLNGALAATPQHFAQRLADLLTHPEEARRLGATARDLARQRYAVPLLVPQYEELYAHLHKERP
ncbi:glycosyltransferase family 4 protein [Candidatus Oscillochloris fontis]|uniref:glycosyltransferase family 4 protein n=1 Tax=Candidatus Oscillochloris fontis TaxID=2496868 RepID=UPI00101C6EDD|nr:glycosyltransferase family 4 protein [Candidatus Oscillochloris fontis]